MKIITLSILGLLSIVPVTAYVINTHKQDINYTKVVDKPTKPKSLDPLSILFNMDSFILTKESQASLQEYISEIKYWNLNNENDKIKDIYISVHCLFGTSSDSKYDKSKQKRMSLFILSTNRTKILKDFFASILADEDIVYHLFPCAFLMSGHAEKKAVISFELDQHMKEAKEASKKLCSEIEVNFDNDLGISSNMQIIDNTYQADRIWGNLKDNVFKDGGRTREVIPIELTYDKLEGVFGLDKNESERMKFKEKWRKKHLI
jgi:hypothetical protein